MTSREKAKNSIPKDMLPIVHVASTSLLVGSSTPVAPTMMRADVKMFGFLKELGLEKPDFLPDFGAKAPPEPIEVANPSPVLKIAGEGMALLAPIFSVEADLQAAVLNLGSYDEEEIKADIDAVANSAPVVIYTYPLSPFSTEAVNVLKSTGCNFEEVPLGLEWFALGPKGSATRVELRKMTGQGSLPHCFIGGEWVGGLATGAEGGLTGLVESGELEGKLRKAKAI